MPQSTKLPRRRTRRPRAESMAASLVVAPPAVAEVTTPAEAIDEPTSAPCAMTEAPQVAAIEATQLASDSVTMTAVPPEPHLTGDADLHDPVGVTVAPPAICSDVIAANDTMILAPLIDLPIAANDTAVIVLSAQPPLQPDAIAKLVERFLERRSEATRRSYSADLRDFAAFRKCDTEGEALARLLADGHGPANGTVLDYQQYLAKLQRTPKDAGSGTHLAAATINRRVAAIRSVVRLARLVGMIPWAIETEGLKVVPYRDTRGPGLTGVQKLLSIAERTRDRAMIRLLHDLALRRAEVVRLDVADVDVPGSRVSVLGKGKTGKIWMTLPDQTVAAITTWLAERGREPGPLLIALDKVHHGHRLSGTSVYRIVRRLGEECEVHARPHGLRHSAISSALDFTGGNTRMVAKFSRHEDERTVGIYDDNRQDLAGVVAKKVADALV